MRPEHETYELLGKNLARTARNVDQREQLRSALATAESAGEPQLIKELGDALLAATLRGTWSRYDLLVLIIEAPHVASLRASLAVRFKPRRPAA